MKNKLWCDLKTNKERVDFLRSGRAWETGILAKAIVEDIAQAFEQIEKYENNECAGCKHYGGMIPDCMTPH